MSDWGDHTVPHTPSPWDGVAAKQRKGLWSVVFLALVAAVIWPSFYGQIELPIAGIPFVYWYTVGWLTAVAISWFAYASEKRRNRAPR